MILPNQNEVAEQMESVSLWSQHLKDLGHWISPRFTRFETWQRAQAYLQGLLSSVERKNGWQLSEHLGESNPYGVQHLLGRAKWDADLVRDDLQHYVLRWLGDKEGVLVVDESGFLKKGDKSAGVARQYSGTAGKVENCQMGVFLCYTSKHGLAFLDRALYVPEHWSKDRARCKEASIPEAVGFATKPQLARVMLERAFLAGAPAKWVTGDSVYGNDPSLQQWLQERRQAYVLAVSGQAKVTIAGQAYQVKDLLKTIPQDAWQILSAGAGAKGERLFHWARRPLECPHAPEWCSWLLVRRSLSDASEVTGYVAFAKAGTSSLLTLVQVAGARWSVEEGFEGAKSEVGLDEYEVRSWTGWHRHVTLSLLAHAYLSVLRAIEAKPESAEPTPSREPTLLPVSSPLAEVDYSEPVKAGKKGALLFAASQARSQKTQKAGSRSLTEFKRRRGLLCP